MEDHEVSMPSLSARIGRERMNRLVDAYAAKGDTEPLMDDMTADLADHLAALRDAGLIVPHDALPNRRMNLQHSWNVMCGTAEHRYSSQEGETLAVARRLSHALISVPLHMLAFDVESGKVDAASRDTRMRAIMTEMDTGDLPWWKLGAYEQDFVSGEELDFEMRGWALVFGRRGGRGEGITPAEDLPAVTMHEIDIDLPTGELLIADWFRSDGFTDLVDEGNPWRGGSQNENERDAERYARDHGFVSVSSARRSLTILRNGDTVTAGHHDEDGEYPLPQGFSRVRDLLIDLRKVSLADKATLISILSRIHPQDRAQEMADEIARDRDTVRIRVEPGRYRISSSGRGYIEDLLTDDSPIRAAGYEPVMMMTRIAA